MSEDCHDITNNNSVEDGTRKRERRYSIEDVSRVISFEPVNTKGVEDGMSDEQPFCKYCDLAIRKTNQDATRNEWEHADGFSFCADGQHWAEPRMAIRSATPEELTAQPTVPVEERTADKCKKCNQLAKLLLEARDALPAISITSARLRNIDLTLANRIETALEPWRIKDENPTS